MTTLVSGCSAAKGLDFCLAIKKGSEHSGNHNRICGEHGSRDQYLSKFKGCENVCVILSLQG